MSDRPRLRVTVTRKLPDVIETRMLELFDTRLRSDDGAMTRAELIEAVQTSDVLVPTITDTIDAPLLAEAGPDFKLIANFGSGVDHIDLAAAHRHKIIVTNTPGALTEDTADLTFGLILAMPRRLVAGVDRMRQGHWQGWSPTSNLGNRVNGKKLGIIGMGRIGQAVARRAKGFAIDVHYFNRRPIPPDIETELQATAWDSLDQMLRCMDIVSIHCPHTPATYHLLSRRRLSLLKPHAVIINTSRGEIIDEDALADALEAGQIAGAALDVFKHEPEVNPRLLKLETLVPSPHIGSATFEGRIDMGQQVVINIQSFYDGHTPPDRVVESMF